MRIKNLSKLLLPMALLSIGFSACETMKGAGRDIEHVSQSAQDASH